MNMRLLVPVNADASVQWGIAYALRLPAEGQAVEGCFLHVGEPITQWQLLRSRTQAEVQRFQTERAQQFIDEASAPLAAEGIPCRGFFRQCDVVVSILDTAEELACDEIVMPRPESGLWGLLSKGVTTHVLQRQRQIPVTLVSAAGISSTDTLH
jgi:nucleotide-binding universal stress UspA family protein